ncbi:MAG: PIN domain-containing protein [Armatimonadetes bacterium]|nr:PIN domain-containing protein [Armatimonadota bacterium]
MGEEEAVVLDTNICVAAGFKPRSDSARLLRAVRDGSLRHRWNEETRRETRYIVRKIPPLSGMDLSGLFREEDRFDGPTDLERFARVPDPEDRKFLALAAETGAPLISFDDHLLAGREESPVPILTPGEFLRGRDEKETEADE